MTEHTSEPWVFHVETSDHGTTTFARIEGSDEDILRGTATSCTLPYEEDLRRIVACVNACEGIPTIVLEHIPDEEVLGLMVHPVPGPERNIRLSWALQATEGIPTEALEGGIVEEMVSLLRDIHENTGAPIWGRKTGDILDRLDGGDE